MLNENLILINPLLHEVIIVVICMVSNQSEIQKANFEQNHTLIKNGGGCVCHTLVERCICSSTFIQLHGSHESLWFYIYTCFIMIFGKEKKFTDHWKTGKNLKSESVKLQVVLALGYVCLQGQ